MDDLIKEAALRFHEYPNPGKIQVAPTKPLGTQYDLSLAYSPGVAYPCLDIQADPSKAAEYTSRGNLVGVITNGTAVLGLGDIGPLAGKPVMEGKGCLFKKFAGIDVFDIELAERDPDKLVEIISALEPTLGGINLEDIKARYRDLDTSDTSRPALLTRVVATHEILSNTTYLWGMLPNLPMELFPEDYPHDVLARITAEMEGPIMVSGEQAAARLLADHQSP